MPMRNIHMHYVKLIFTLMLAVLVGACGESTAPSSSKNEAASTTEQSFVESKKRADSGDADAQVNLGLLYGKGEGVPQDFAQARQWWQKAAAQGDAQAQVNLGLLYAKGEGVPQDFAQAREWYQKAAVQGDEAAQVSLGLSYLIGDGVPEDSVLAYAWLNLSAAQGNENAKGVRDIVIPKRSQFSSAQRAEAERLSSNWKPGQVLRRESESASAAGNMEPAGGALISK